MRKKQNLFRRLARLAFRKKPKPAQGAENRPAASGHHASNRLRADIRGSSMRNPARQAPPRRLAPYKKRSRMESLGEAGRSLARSRSISMVSSAFLLFVFVYIVRFVLAFATKEAVKVEKVVYATMDAPVTVSGLIIRDESVYQSPAEGTVKFLVANHARVKKGSVVCTVENTAEIEKAQPDLDKIDQELLKMQEERDFVAYSAEQENINEQIKIRVDSQIMSFAKGDLAIAYSLKDSVSQSVDARNRLALSSGTVGQGTYALGAQRQAIISVIEANTAAVTVEESGIVASVLDGFENLSFSGIDKLTLADVDVSADYSRFASVRQAKVNDSLFKIVASNEWYIAASVPNGMIEGWEEGEQRTLYLSKQGEFTSMPVVVRRLEKGVPNSLAVFKTTRGMLDYLSQREVEFKTENTVTEGLKIPERAIAEKALVRIPEEYVTVVDGRYFINIDPKGETEISVAFTETGAVYAAAGVGSFSLGDVILSSEGISYTLFDTAIAKGVYRINFGTAEFRRINVDEDMKIDDCYLLDPEINKSIQAYDWIASYAAEVEEDQIIY